MGKRTDNWSRYDEIKADYLSGMSFHKLEQKYAINHSNIHRRAKQEGWQELRDKIERETDRKIVRAISSHKADVTISALSVADSVMAIIQAGVEDGSLIGDAQDVRSIVAALRDLASLRGEMSKLDEEEQKARIEKLRKDVSDSGESVVRVVMGSAEEYAE